MSHHHFDTIATILGWGVLFSIQIFAIVAFLGTAVVLVRLLRLGARDREE